MYEQVGDTDWQAMLLLTRGRILVQQERLGDAARSLATALAASDALSQREFAAGGLVAVVAMAREVEDEALAAQLLGASDGLFEVFGASWTASAPADRALRERTLAAARGSLGQSSFDTAYASGRVWTLEQAIAKALAALALLDGSAATRPRSRLS